MASVLQPQTVDIGISTATKSADKIKPTKPFDPFKYGWRIRWYTTDDGQIKHERIPLTSLDILHPEENDFRVHNHEHKRFCHYLDNVFISQSANNPGAVVLHDTRIEWDVPDLRPHGPDIALIFDVRKEKKWGTFKVAEEGTRPILIVEVTSPETRRLDLEDKVDQYERAGVQYFVIVDTHIDRQQSSYQLIGYELTPDGYVFMPKDERGWIWLEPVQVWIGLDDNLLVCYDSNGNQIGDYAEITQLANEEKLRADEEKLRADEEKLRANEEKLRADEEKLRADTAEQRVSLEAQQRKELEKQLEAMQEELRRAKNQAKNE